MPEVVEDRIAHLRADDALLVDHEGFRHARDAEIDADLVLFFEDHDVVGIARVFKNLTAGADGVLIEETHDRVLRPVRFSPTR